MKLLLQNLESVVPAAGTVVAAVILAVAGIVGYRQQKEADRKHELIQHRQDEYQAYLLAFQQASRWKGVDPWKHAEAEALYHDTHNNMLLTASDEVINAANAAHNYYTESDQVDWRKYKKLYAEMIIAMRKDGFERTNLSLGEVAKNIPWTIGTEREDRGLRPTADTQALMQPENGDKETPMHAVVGRKVLAWKWDADDEKLKNLDDPEGGTVVHLDQHEAIASLGTGWHIVSHTFQILPDGGAVLTIVLENT
jgi:hypothetical protein